MNSIETRAREFHDAYERLAPQFGYETRPETREFDPDSPNGRLMMAVIAALTPPEGYVLVPVEAQQEAKRFRWLRTCSREQYLLARGMFGLVDDTIDAVIQSEEAEAHNGK